MPHGVLLGDSIFDNAGLAAWTPTDPEVYRQRALLTAVHGYAAGVPR